LAHGVEGSLLRTDRGLAGGLGQVQRDVAVEDGAKVAAGAAGVEAGVEHGGHRALVAVQPGNSAKVRVQDKLDIGAIGIKQRSADACRRHHQGVELSAAKPAGGQDRIGRVEAVAPGR